MTYKGLMISCKETGGIKLQNEEDTNQEEIVQPKKRGRKPKATI